MEEREMKKKVENTQREKQAERYFRKCGGKLYIHKSINRVPVCAAMHSVRYSTFSEAEKYVYFFVSLCTLAENNMIGNGGELHFFTLN